ncbi:MULTISPECIES: hypothetical protein [Stenotrophomonas]|uniref:hypothetical protein n=1 Tax=Stenotrophomonas TaxID=40323 RepID=UPI000D53DAF1|nr:MULTISPECIES: hypothetical protein [Stenotrophomonas]AWH27495.1 hypothetical protein C1931_00285 [Stenotrophomonas sp. YAU14A_MKIMI4_1]
MHLLKLPVAGLLITLLLGACAQAETPRNMSPTQTNEEGCTRKRSLGPQNAYADPAPIKQACVGPYLLELPQNYFSNQMGTEHDGSFSLALEYPALQPFKPGERMNLSADVSIRTVRIDYTYIDRVNLWDVMRKSYTRKEYQQGDPSETLEERIKGDPVHGLVPYYVDVAKVQEFYRKQGFDERAPIIQHIYWQYDWFVSRNAADQIDQVIKCTTRDVAESGVMYRDGKMVKKPVFGFAECNQRFVIEELSVIAEVHYPREGIADWKTIRERTRALLIDNSAAERTR